MKNYQFNRWAIKWTLVIERIPCATRVLQSYLLSKNLELSAFYGDLTELLQKNGVKDLPEFLY